MRDYLAARARYRWVTRHPVRLGGKWVICHSFIPAEEIEAAARYWR